MHSFGGIPPTISEDILIYFVAHCAHIRGLCYSTIKGYLAGVRNMYIEHGCGNPFTLPDGSAMLRLQLIMRGIRKDHVPRKLPRLPITAKIMQELCQQLKRGQFGAYMDSLLHCALTIGWFGCLRCGELVSTSDQFDPTTDLAVRYISVSYLTIILRIMTNDT
jgi:hypothetical protein